MQESAQSVFPLTQKEESAADKSAAVPLMILKAFPSEAPAVHSDTNLRECIRPRDTSLGIQGRLQGLMDQDLCVKGHSTSWDTLWEWCRMQNLESPGLVSRSWSAHWASAKPDQAEQGLGLNGQSFWEHSNIYTEKSQNSSYYLLNIRNIIGGIEFQKKYSWSVVSVW